MSAPRPSPFRCAVPFHPDPGQPQIPVTGQPLYLVTGVQVNKPGAYMSWSSASAQYTGVSAATLKRYRSWPPLECAWFAACARGEHDHPGDPILSSSLTVGRSSSDRRSPHAKRAHPPSLSAPTANLSSHPSAANPPTVSHAAHLRPLSSFSALPAPAVPGKIAYAVGTIGQSQGIVFDSYGSARNLYHQLQAAGESPSLAAASSLTDGICLVDGFMLQGPSAEASQRRGEETYWISDSESESELEVSGTVGDSGSFNCITFCPPFDNARKIALLIIVAVPVSRLPRWPWGHGDCLSIYSTRSTSMALVATLATRQKLACMVRSLIFEDDGPFDSFFVGGPLLDKALAQMSNLHRLTVPHYVHLTASSIAGITFRLRSFACHGIVTQSLADLLSGQDDLEELVIEIGFLNHPKPGFCPHLKRIQASTGIVAQIAPGRPIREVHFFNDCSPTIDRPGVNGLMRSTGHIVRIRLMARQLSVLSRRGSLLEHVEELVVDEDFTWAGYRPHL
ncbi:hypothetical protein B0H17DRAFT_1135187 [Mycena rosella]|uniref:Uncharacterized protein n=1 Tax=Mycena rosella TaxID=1033263 RepID=A0AAD7DE52_MYCRO|nr:hypothetical protein B0H17DRAFT_1135187 [Mycena rosella]